MWWTNLESLELDVSQNVLWSCCRFTAGIVASTCRELPWRGAFVVVDYPFSSLLSRVTKVCSSLSGRSIAVEADLSTVDGLKRFVDEIMKEFGRVEILVDDASLAVNEQFEE